MTGKIQRQASDDEMQQVTEERIRMAVQNYTGPIDQIPPMYSALKVGGRKLYTMFTHKNQAHLQEVLDLENAIDDMEETLQRSHIKRLTKGKCTPEAGIIFSDVISGLERVSDHDRSAEDR